MAVAVGAYDLEAGVLEASRTQVGLSGQGTFNQSGGTHTVGYSYYPPSAYDIAFLRIGNQLSEYDQNSNIPENLKAYGIYNLSGGQLNVLGSTVVGSGSDSYVHSGYGGLGFFNQSGGTSTMHNLVVGESGTKASGEGHVTVSGTAEMNVSGTIYVGVASGETPPAKGSFEQTGGNIVVDEKILIGESANGAAANAYRVLGGQTTVADGVVVGTDEMSNGLSELEVGNGGLLAADVLVKSEGLLIGANGTIIGDVSLDGGVIAPGNSPGTMTIDGNLILDLGTLLIEDYGLGEKDFVEVSGDVLFGDNVTVELLFGYRPTDVVEIEDYFTIGGGSLFGDAFDPTTAIDFSFIEGKET